MRLWSLHPRYLDAKGLVACWREGLLARKVLLGETRGYKNHPQLERFKQHHRPVDLVNAFLSAICDEAELRGYRFDRSKIGPNFSPDVLTVTKGQLRYEFEWLRSKLAARDPKHLAKLDDTVNPLPTLCFASFPAIWRNGNDQG
jgi:hypothetical protein